jgi:HemY protein
MIRVLLFLALVALVALGAVWIADRPGDIAITWQGWRIETSVMVAAVTLGGIVVVR